MVQLLLSLLLHGIVLLILIVSFEFSSTMPVVENADKNTQIIDAVVMDPPADRPVPRVKTSPSPPPPEVKQTVQAKPVEQQIKQEAIAIQDQRKQKKLQQAAIAKQLLADLKKQTAKQKQAKQKTLEKAFEKELKEQAAKSLQEQLLQEQKSAASSAKVQGEVNKYKALILQAISRRWLVPGGVDKKLSSQLLIRLAPGGDVLDVQVTKSSGNVALDQSARDAVFKASPLPVPEDAAAFDQFRQFVLKVKPQILTEG